MNTNTESETHRTHNHNHLHNIELQNNNKKTLTVLILTLITMSAEIFFGYFCNSMALLSDGCHMATHALAFLMVLIAYYFMAKIQNRHNSDKVCHKISAFAGYTSSLLLVLTAFFIIIESFDRFFNPLKISFNEAILVSIIGLIVNLVCIFIMENKEKHEDYNFKSAYFHILSDILTSVFAIIALLSGKFFGIIALDPLMGFIASFLILKWSFGLIKDTSKTLLDLNLLD